MTASAKLVIAGRVLAGLVCVPFAFGIYTALNGSPEAAEGMAKMGWPAASQTLITTLMVISLALYLIPPTAVLGAVMLTGYLGGAVATHLRVDDPPTAAVIVGVLAWLALWMREPRVRELLPLRRGT